MTKRLPTTREAIMQAFVDHVLNDDCFQCVGVYLVCKMLGQPRSDETIAQMCDYSQRLHERDHQLLRIEANHGRR